MAGGPAEGRAATLGGVPTEEAAVVAAADGRGAGDSRGSAAAGGCREVPAVRRSRLRCSNRYGVCAQMLEALVCARMRLCVYECCPLPW